MDTFNVAIQTLQLEKQALETRLRRYSDQVSCEHPEDQRVMQENAGYDIDESGEEYQHLEICTKCGAQRFHLDHTKHGKSIGCWMAT